MPPAAALLAVWPLGGMLSESAARRIGVGPMYFCMKSPVVKRSVVVGGHKTSVSLEHSFWSSLKEISKERGMTLAELISEIDASRQQGNLLSAVRLFVLDHYKLRAAGHSAGASEQWYVRFCDKAAALSPKIPNGKALRSERATLLRNHRSLRRAALASPVDCWAAVLRRLQACCWKPAVLKLAWATPATISKASAGLRTSIFVHL